MISSPPSAASAPLAALSKKYRAGLEKLALSRTEGGALLGTSRPASAVTASPLTADGSDLGGSPLPSPADYIFSCPHDQYRRRTQASITKLKRFFGTMPPVDIPVSVISKEGLKAMLRSTGPLCYFLHSLLKDHCSENLFFFLDVEQYECYNFKSEKRRWATANHLYRVYLNQNSQLEINIEDKVRQKIARELETRTCPVQVFQQAKAAVIALMEGSFAKFKQGPEWAQMVDDLASGSEQGDNLQKGVALLRNHLRDLPAPFNGTHMKRDKMIHCMVEEFCLAFAKIDITDETGAAGLEEREDQKKRATRLPALL